MKSPEPIAATSSLDPLREAASIPSGVPTRMVATIAVPRSSTVAGSLTDISSTTGLLLQNEKPKLNVNMFRMYFRYLICIGSSRPNIVRS